MGKILSVDDSALIRKIVGEAVGVIGKGFLEAENGTIALEVLEKEHENIELIIMDWHMPELNGYETLVKIKENDNFKNIPVMMVTTENEKDKILLAIKAGAATYMIKPFSIIDLTVKIKEMIGDE